MAKLGTGMGKRILGALIPVYTNVRGNAQKKMRAGIRRGFGNGDDLGLGCAWYSRNETGITLAFQS